MRKVLIMNYSMNPPSLLRNHHKSYFINMRKFKEVPPITEEAKLFKELSKVRPCDTLINYFTKEMASHLLWIIYSGRSKKMNRFRSNSYPIVKYDGYVLYS